APRSRISRPARLAGPTKRYRGNSTSAARSVQHHGDEGGDKEQAERGQHDVSDPADRGRRAGVGGGGGGPGFGAGIQAPVGGRGPGGREGGGGGGGGPAAGAWPAGRARPRRRAARRSVRPAACSFIWSKTRPKSSGPLVISHRISDAPACWTLATRSRAMSSA